MPQIVFDGIALTVAISIAFVTWMWWLVWSKQFCVPIFSIARIFSIAFGIQFALYAAYSFFLVDIELRAITVRMSIIVICLAQAIPLWIAYRTWRLDGQDHP